MNLPPPKPGVLLARGTLRYLRSINFLGLEEFVPKPGRRVDIIAIGPKSEIWIIECKSSREDFNSDNKWQEYLEWCDKYFWAVPNDFPTEILPPDTGLIFADPYGAEMITDSPHKPLSPARRKKLLLKVARNSLERLSRFTDPRI